MKHYQTCECGGAVCFNCVHCPEGCLVARKFPPERALCECSHEKKYHNFQTGCCVMTKDKNHCSCEVYRYSALLNDKYAMYGCITKCNANDELDCKDNCGCSCHKGAE